MVEMGRKWRPLCGLGLDAASKARWGTRGEAPAARERREAAGREICRKRYISVDRHGACQNFGQRFACI